MALIEEASAAIQVKPDHVESSVDSTERLAKEAYPTPTLFNLWKESLADPGAVDKAMALRARAGRILESVPVDSTEMRVTYVAMGDDDTQDILMGGGPDFFGTRMKRLGKTHVFFCTQIVPNDGRFRYYFNLYERPPAGPLGVAGVEQFVHSSDSLLEMPKAPPQRYVAPRSGVEHGQLVQRTLTSSYLKEDRRISVYTSPGADGATPCNLVVLLDGEVYGGLSNEVPTPTIVDNLLAERKIGPTVVVLVWSLGKRDRDLVGSMPFADFIADEVVPWARSHYRIVPGPHRVVVAGSSLGGFAATYCALTHSDVIGNVLSQSGSYWLTRQLAQKSTGSEFYRRAYPRETGEMIQEFKSRPRLPIRFYIEIGIYDLGAAMLGSNRELRDVLELKGYRVDYREFTGEHSFVNWRGSLADGLISLLGTAQARSNGAGASQR